MIVGITMAAAVSMIGYQYKELTHIKEQLASHSLKYLLLQNIKDLARCSCHFTQSNMDANGDSLGPFTIDTTTDDGDSYNEINLGSIRSGCDFSSINNVIIKNGDRLPGTSVEVEGIVAKVSGPTGEVNEFLATITVSYKQKPGSRLLRSIEIPTILSIDTAQGDDGIHPIKSCGPQQQMTTSPHSNTIIVTNFGSVVCGKDIRGSDNADCSGIHENDLKWANIGSFRSQELSHLVPLGI